MAVSYQYNGANELVRENNHTNSYTMTYEYDSWGNLTKKQRYAYTTATDPGTPTETISYTYGNSAWKDRLTKYNGQTISYDAMGNPTTYLGKTLTWNGKELTGVTGTASYTYDMNGLRTTKTVGGVTTNYFYNNTVLMGLTSGSNKLLFSYDANGLVQAVNFNGTYYYYMRNGQGDIIKLVDADGTAVVKYGYDSWGKQLSCTGTLATTLGALNPFRYRGYFYDEETQWYYLKSRYYDPETCRFISADVYLSTGQGVLGHNSYVYGLNNPLILSDDDGEFSLPNWAKVAIGATVIVGLAVATVCTGGAAAVICGAALTGAITGGASGAVIGAVSGAISDGLDGAIDGACSGFMSGTIIGGVTGAASAGINIASGTTSIVGNAHGSALHKLSSNMQAGKMAASGSYSKIGLNKALKTMGLNGAKRPDVIGIGYDGINKLVEVVSPKQNVGYVINKMGEMLADNPNTVGIIVKWVRRMGEVIR